MIIRPIMIVNLTNLRIARGQTVANTADLIVTRDNLGRIYIPATALKGSARSHITLTKEKGEIIAKFFFGSTDEETEEVEFKKHIGFIGFQDAHLVFIPVPSTLGTLYITSPLLLQKLFEAQNIDTRVLIDIQETLSDDTIKVNAEEGRIDLAGGITLKAVRSQIVEGLESFVLKVLKTAGLGGILDAHVGIVSDNIMDIIIDKALIIRPGIQIKGFMDDKTFYNKVVSKAGPRFEEEVPLGSIFIGNIMLCRQEIELERIVKNGKEVKEIIEGILREIISEVTIKLGSKTKIEFNADVLDSIIDSIETIFIGSRETLTKGLIKIIKVTDELKINKQKLVHDTQLLTRHNLKAKSKINQQENETQKEILRIQKEIVRITDIKKLINNVFGEKIMVLAEKLKGKVAGLPEKFRMMDPITVLYFYLAIKGSGGIGFEELRKIGEYILNEDGFRLKDIEIDEEGYIKSGIDNYLCLFDKLTRMFTLLKYIIRSYGE